MAGKLRRLTTVVSFHPKTGLIIPVSGLEEEGFFLEMVALQSLMVSTVENLGISAAVHEGEV